SAGTFRTSTTNPTCRFSNPRRMLVPVPLPPPRTSRPSFLDRVWVSLFGARTTALGNGNLPDDSFPPIRSATMTEHLMKETAKGRARKVMQKPPVLGWRTSDEDELNLRRWRGRTEIAGIEVLEPEHGPFGTFRVRSSSGSVYDVEIRDLAGRNNSCGCIDHRVNGLGICKHIEGVLAALRTKRGVSIFKAASAKRVEIFLSRAGTALPTILWPKAGPDAKARAFLGPFCGRDSRLKTAPANIKALVDAAPAAPKSVRIS